MQRDLIVFSHLRWTWVWQRPQHLVSRLAPGRKVWFVEEPMQSSVSTPTLRTMTCGDIARIWLDLPDEHRAHIGFEDRVLQMYRAALPGLVGDSDDRIVWLYSPLAVDVAASLNPRALVYDVMDDLSSFRNAPTELKLRHRAALHSADVVLAGGRTLHRNVVGQRPDAHCFPSGVEVEHYERAKRHRRHHLRPVAGYVGVIDERLDLDLIRGLAGELPDWDIVLVGPTAKIAPDEVPSAPNIYAPGGQTYAQLPEVMALFDVALMPFALNEATRSISPTKTLEYLAAGLPVISTLVDDVVADFTGVVDFADNAEGFAAACRRLLTEDSTLREQLTRPVLHGLHWDRIAQRIANVLAAVPTYNGAEDREVSA
jgi:glycosyltransferase involved in cell wall biosynthesis